MKVRLRNGGKVYVIVFDEEYVLDMVTREHDGKVLTSKDPVCKSVLSHERTIRSGQIPKGFERA